MEVSTRERRGVLRLGEEAGGAAGGACAVLRLAPGEERHWLEQAQGALWELRKRCDWVCVAAGRAGAGLAAALAAQLNVERLALTESRLFDRSGPRLQGYAARLERFARRNLALVIAEVLLIDASDREIRGFAAQMGRERVCALEGCRDGIFTAPWGEVNENNLLIPEKCV